MKTPHRLKLTHASKPLTFEVEAINERGEAVLRALDEVAQAHSAPVPAVALAWLASQDTVASPIASARTPEQLGGLLALDGLELTGEEIDRLAAASS